MERGRLKVKSLKEREREVEVKCPGLYIECGHEFQTAPDGEILSTGFSGDWLDICPAISELSFSRKWANGC